MVTTIDKNLEKGTAEIRNTPYVLYDARCDCGQYIAGMKIQEGAHNNLIECSNPECRKQYDVRSAVVMTEIEK